MNNKPVVWTDKHTKIVKEYERRKKEGTIKEYVLIEKDDTKEQIKERFNKLMGRE